MVRQCGRARSGSAEETLVEEIPCETVEHNPTKFAAPARTCSIIHWRVTHLEKAPRLTDAAVREGFVR